MANLYKHFRTLLFFFPLSLPCQPRSDTPWANEVAWRDVVSAASVAILLVMPGLGTINVVGKGQVQATPQLIKEQMRNDGNLASNFKASLTVFNGLV